MPLVETRGYMTRRKYVGGRAGVGAGVVIISGGRSIRFDSVQLGGLAR
jgi:hypothetical protein